MHVEAADWLENRPAAHNEHAERELSAPKEPALQRLQTVAFAGAKEPGRHAAHADNPGPLANRPDGQVEQLVAVSSEEKEPGAQSLH